MDESAAETEHRGPLHFAGRDDELQMLGTKMTNSMKPGGARNGMTLISGVPGIGKTELALQFAAASPSPSITCSVKDLENPRTRKTTE